MATAPSNWLSAAEYLARERAARERGEYFDGIIYAMAGANRRHNLVVSGTVAALMRKLTGRRCEVYPSDMRDFTPATHSYAYPDVTVVCGEPQFADEHEDVLLNPKVIFEVLSKSTEAFDRTEKFRRYGEISSLAQYVLVRPDNPLVQSFTRQPDGTWLLAMYDQPANIVPLDSIQTELTLAEIFAAVDVLS